MVKEKYSRRSNPSLPFVVFVALAIFSFGMNINALLSGHLYMYSLGDDLPLAEVHTPHHVKNEKCLNLEFEENMDALLANHKQIFIAMPAKAAGSSLKNFTGKCMKRNMRENYINFGPEGRKHYLSDYVHPPSIITSHFYTDEPLVHLSKYPIQNALTIYVHRDETDRVISGIKEVLLGYICVTRPPHFTVEGATKQFNMLINETTCILDEAPSVKLIETRFAEVGFGANDILTCNSYNAMIENDPNMVFINYKQANRLQKLLAKHHCPELLKEKPSMRNNGKPVSLYLRLEKKEENGNDLISIEDWLKEKSGVLEWTLKLRKAATCQAKTKHMQEAMLRCPDQTLRVDSYDLKKW